MDLKKYIFIVIAWQHNIHSTFYETVLLLAFEVMGENINKTDPCSLILLKVLHPCGLASTFIMFCFSYVPFNQYLYNVRVALHN